MELKIDAISDTHNKHKKLILPGGDILIHAGDATLGGKVSEVLNFLDWFSDQDYSHLIFVPGNHDWLFEENSSLVAEECQKRRIILLNDSGIEVEGIKIWGSPVQPWFFDWAFNRHPGKDIEKHWELIPEDTEILITHGPAKGRLDYIPNQNKGVGCPSLYRKILETKVKLHICGHIHEGKGHLFEDDRLWVNASFLDGKYHLTTCNPTTIIKNSDGKYQVSES